MKPSCREWVFAFESFYCMEILSYFGLLLPTGWGWAVSQKPRYGPLACEVTSFYPVALAGRFFPQTHVSHTELTVGWSWEIPEYLCSFRGLWCCHAVLMSPSLLGPCFHWDPWGAREAWAKFYDLSPQAVLLCTVYKSLHFHESSTLWDHCKCGFTSTFVWLLSGGDTFCPST
jgi:hypothetical protein